uniref:Uncharacterized protein n=1 Tax=Leersia perrieri TaxID=77586 RepID=A0A0D9VBX0_9ORYZ
MPPSADIAVAAAAMPPQSPRLHALLSFDALAAADEVEDATPPPSSSEDDGLMGGAGFDLDFAFAPPVSSAAGGGDMAPADDIFAHGRIVPTYPVFDRRLLDLTTTSPSADEQPPSADADTYCAWTPRSAPGSPRRDARFPKSASTGSDSSSSSSSASTSRRWRLRDLVGVTGGRSRSDGKDKFGSLHHAAAAAAAPASSKLSSSTEKKQSTVKKAAAAAGKKGVATEMDMATAHKLFYSKNGGAVAGGERRPLHQASYMTYRPAFAGIFAIGRSQHHTAY